MKNDFNNQRNDRPLIVAQQGNHKVFNGESKP